MEIRAMETNIRVLGEEHPDTLTSMANLTLTCLDQGCWKQAEELDVRVMETRKRVLGEEHPDTMANLVSTYRDQGRWREAEELNVYVLKIRKNLLDEEHPSTLSSIANLASTYRNKGHWKKAEELEVRVMKSSMRVQGEENPNTLNSVANLASTYRGQRRTSDSLSQSFNELTSQQAVHLCSREWGIGISLSAGFFVPQLSATGPFCGGLRRSGYCSFSVFGPLGVHIRCKRKIKAHVASLVWISM